MKRENLFKMLGFGVIFLLIGVLVSGCTLTKKDDTTDDIETEATVTTETDETENTTEEDTIIDEDELNTEDETTTEEEEPITTTTDFTKFTASAQTVGSSHTGEYTLNSVLDTPQSGFHRIVFNLSAKGAVTVVPYVVVDYRAALGSIRIDLNGVTTDNSGIGYQESRMINKEGLIKLYHNVSADQSEELYDIGVASAPLFYVYSNKVSTSIWEIVVEVKYPGASSTTIDTGSTAFSQNKQEMAGANVSDGAAVNTVSYNTVGGVFSFVWNVSGSSAKPIPQVYAGYNGTGQLVVVFSSLNKDNVKSFVDTLEMSGLVSSIKYSAEGAGSSYTFTLTSKRDFKLSSSLSPNQVVLDIK